MDEDDDDDDEENDSEEMGSDEEMSIEEWNRMMAEGGYEEGDSESGSDEEDLEEGSEDEDETVEFEDGTKIGDSDEEMGSDEEDEEDDEDEEDEDEDDEDDEGGSEEEDEDEDDEEDANPDVDMDDEDGLFPPAGPSKRKKAKHPVLDDDFFSIDEFNRMTEEQEAERVTSGRLGGDEEDEEPELDDFSSMFLSANDNPADMKYDDFFAPPAQAASKSKGKGKGKELAGKKKKKAARFEESDEEDEEPEEEDDGEGVDDVMDRVKTDLFEDSEDEGEEEALSTHEKRQRELAQQIAELEKEAIGPKDWTLLGEASSRARPENSLLEENLDFEHVAKVVPVITEESVATLEELIKKRILDVSTTYPLC